MKIENKITEIENLEYLKKFKTTTAKEILEKELEEMPFVVEKLLPIGWDYSQARQKLVKVIYLCG